MLLTVILIHLVAKTMEGSTVVCQQPESGRMRIVVALQSGSILNVRD